MDADDREELRVLTLTWNDEIRTAFLDEYERRRAAGASHEVALMTALGALLR